MLNSTPARHGSFAACVGAQRECPVDDSLIPCCVHNAMVHRLAMILHVGVKAVTAPHVQVELTGLMRNEMRFIGPCSGSGVIC